MNKSHKQKESISIKDALTENTKVHLAYLDSKFNFLAVNSMYAKGSGYKKTELLGKNHFDLFPSKENENIFKRVRDTGKAMEFKTKPFTFSGHPERGTTYWDWTLTPIKNQSNQVDGLVLSLLDVTEQKRSEQRILVQYLIVRLMAESDDFDKISTKILKIIGKGFDWAFGEFWKVDKENKVLKCSQLWQSRFLHTDKFREATKNITFQKGVGIPGRVWKSAKPVWVEDVLKDLNFPRNSFAAEEGIHAAFAFPIIVENEVAGVLGFFNNRIQCPDKELLKVIESISNQIGQFIEHRRAENELHLANKASKELNKKIINILESITDAFFALDGNLKFTYVNRRTEQIFHKKREKMIGMNIWKVFPKAVKSTFYKKINESIKLQSFLKFEIYYKPSNQYFEARIYPAKEGLSIYFQDITERKVLEKRKDEFISVVSHELKTPITSLKAYIQIIKKHLEELNVEELRHYLSRIEDQLNKTTKIIRDLSVVSKIQSGGLEFADEKFSIDSLLTEIVEDMQNSSIRHKIIKRGKIENKIIGDKYRIGQVVINLISNAIKYSPNANKVFIKIAKKNKEIMVSVQDFGVGIPKENFGKIFQRFYRGEDIDKNIFPGLGLGLYIAAEIIKRYKGYIGVKSIPGKGSTFYFTLPLK